MPRERVQDPLAGRLGRLGVIATGDTSVAPANAGRTTSGNGAGLSSLGGSLIQFSGQLQDRADATAAEMERQARIQSGEDAENKKAAAALFKQYQGDLSKAVASGRLTYGVNPAAWRGFEGAKLENLGVKYSVALNEAYNQSFFDGSESPDQFEEFLGSFTEEYGAQVAGSDPVQLLESYYPHLESAGAALRRKFNTDRSNYIEDASVELVQAHVFDSVDSVLSSVGDLSSPESQELLASLATTLIDVNNPNSPAANGIARRTINDAFVNALVSKAKETGQIGALEILKMVKTGGTTTLADIPRYRDAILEAQADIADDTMKNMRFAAWKEDRDKKELMDSLEEEGTRLLIEGDIRGLNALKRSMVENGFSVQSEELTRLQEAFAQRGARIIEQPGVRLELRQELLESNGENALAIVNQYIGVLPNEVLVQALDKWATTFKSPEIQDIFQSYNFTFYEGKMDKAILATGLGINVYKTPLAQTAEAANRELRDRTVAFFQENNRAPFYGELSDMIAEVMLNPEYGLEGIAEAAGSTAKRIAGERVEDSIEGDRAEAQSRGLGELGDLQAIQADVARQEAEAVRVRQEAGESTGNVFDSFDPVELQLPPVGKEVDERMPAKPSRINLDMDEVIS